MKGLAFVAPEGRRQAGGCDRLRAVAGNVRRQRRHSRHSWQRGFCKLQIPQGLIEFEPYPLSHL